MLAEWRVVTPVVRAQVLPVPAIYSALRDLPEGAVMSLPDYSTGPEWYFGADYLLFSTAHWRPIVNGFGRAAPPEHAPLVQRLSTFPSPDSAALARRIGVRYFVVHTDQIANARAGRGGAAQPGLRPAGRRRRRLSLRGDAGGVGAPVTGCGKRRPEGNRHAAQGKLFAYDPARRKP